MFHDRRKPRRCQEDGEGGQEQMAVGRGLLHKGERRRPRQRQDKDNPLVKSAVVYEADDNAAYIDNYFEIELILKNGDRIELCGVKSDLTFLEDDRHAGIRLINGYRFDYSRLFEGTWPCIPCKDLAAVFGKNEYVDVESFLNDYTIIKDFLL